MTIETTIDTVHVFAVDLPMADVAALADDAGRLSDLLGTHVDASRVEALDTTALADLGLVAYLTDGEGIENGPVRADAGRLNARKGPVLILRPRAVSASLTPKPPLEHLGSYRVEAPNRPTDTLRAASAEGSASGVPTEAPRPGQADRRASGRVAMVALLVALLIALIVWLIAI